LCPQDFYACAPQELYARELKIYIPPKSRILCLRPQDFYARVRSKRAITHLLFQRIFPRQTSSLASAEENLKLRKRDAQEPSRKNVTSAGANYSITDTGLIRFTRFFLTQFTQTGGDTKLLLNDQMTTKYTKWQYSIPNGNRIYKLTFSIPSPSKIYPSWDFWFENIPPKWFNCVPHLT
jgi:hypothetical protein